MTEKNERGGESSSRVATGPMSNKRPRSGVMVEPFQRQLYELIVHQLYHDGFVSAASTVADAASVCLGSSLQRGVNSDRLTSLVSNGLMMESMSRQELEEYRALHVVERYMEASKLYVPLYLGNYWHMGRKQHRWRQKFLTSSLGGVIRHVSFSKDGAYVGCTGTNGLALIFCLRTLEDVVAIEHVREANRRRGIVDWSSSGNTSGGAGKETPAKQPTIQNANEITDVSIARRIDGYTQSVEVMQFHPERPLVVCGGRGGELAIHNVGPADAKLEVKVQDSYPVRTAAWHPSGEYVLFGTDHPLPRLFSVVSEAVLTPPQTSMRPNLSGSEREPVVSTGGVDGDSSSLVVQHTAGITGVDFSPDGRTWASASLDGSWALCDGVSGAIVHKVNAAHSKVPVTSIAYSRTGNVLLTAGMDSTARLWDLRYLPNSHQSSSFSQKQTPPSSLPAPSPVADIDHPSGVNSNINSEVPSSSRPNLATSVSSCEVMSFGVPDKCEHRSIRAVFSSDESHILCQDADLTAVNGYCVYTGDAVYSITTEPALMQRGLAVSPIGNVIITGGDDCRLRLWTPSLISA